jgi:hypothetical protein
LLLESICRNPFQARASNVQIPKLRQHSSNHIMPCFTSVFGTFRGTWDQSDENPAAQFMLLVDIFWNITNCDILWPGMLIAWNSGPLSFVGSTYNGHNCRSGWKLILCILLPLADIHLAVDLTTIRVSKAHWFKIGVCLKWEMCQEKQNKLHIIPVVYNYTDM